MRALLVGAVGIEHGLIFLSPAISRRCNRLPNPIAGSVHVGGVRVDIQERTRFPEAATTTSTLTDADARRGTSSARTILALTM